MKRKFQRTLSCFLAGSIIASSMFTNVFYAEDIDVTEEAVESGSAVYTADGETGSVVFYEAAPAALSSYSFDLTAVDPNVDLAAGISSEDGFIKYSGPGRYHSTGYGIAPATGGKFEIMVPEGTTKVSFTVSKYAPEDGVFAVTDSAGNSVGSVSAYNAEDKAVNIFEYTGDATTLTFTYSGAKECYIPLVAVSNSEKVEPLAAAEQGAEYVADFESFEEAAAYDKMTFADNHIRTNGTGGLRGSGNKHGADIKPNDSFELSVAGPANIEILSCTYSYKEGVFTLYDTEGNVVDSVGALPEENVNADGTEKPLTLRYDGSAGTVKVVYTGAGQAYVHNVKVQNDAAPLGEAEDFELWLDDLASAKDGTGKFAPQSISYKASTVELIGAAGEDFVCPNENFIGLEREGKIVNAYKAGTRPQVTGGAHCNDMQAIPVQGDGNSMVFTPAARGMFTVFVRAWDGKEARVWKFKDGVQQGYTSYNTGDKAVESISFVAEPGYQYVICTTGQTNNFAFCGVKYIVDNKITLPVDAWKLPDGSSYNFDASKFELYDVYLGTKVADIDKSTTSISVLSGHKYQIKSLDPGVGATFASTTIDVDTLSAASGSVQLVLEEIPDTTLSGTFITSDGKDPDVQQLVFKNNISGSTYEAVISEDGKSYTCTMKPGEYTADVTAGSYNAVDHASVSADGTSVDDIFLKELETSLYDLPTEISNKVSKLQFIPAEGGTLKYNNATSISATDGGKIIVPVSGKKKVMVSGWYDGTWDINGQNEISANKDDNGNAQSLAVNEYITDGTETEVTINIKESPTYLYWIKVVDVDDYKWDANNTVLQVPSEKFPTLKSANDYIKNIQDRPEGEEGRMTIELTADVEEQIVFDAPYVTLKGNGHEISWYYGVGTYYYSIDKATGLYDETLFYDKYASQEGNGSLWGGVAIIRGDYFLAEDTIFRNNYNYKATDKYKADVASSAFVLDKETGELLPDLGVYAAKERSNAFYVEAKNIEVYNCQILSSQDSFGRNGSADGGYSIYLKDSVIGGNVDYICGEFKAVFDNCELQWKTYTDKSNSGLGYITAAKTNPYIFRNCTVTIDNEQNEKAADTAGYYGRTWGPGSNVTFYNTETNGYIGVDGKAWGAMNGGDTDSTFYEYMNKSKGAAFESLQSTNAVVVPAVLPEDKVASYTTDNIIDDVLGGWTPVHYGDSDRMWGDVDKNGSITANDASITYQIALISTFGDNDPDIDKEVADVDGVAGITAADSAWILQKALVSTIKFPVEENGQTPGGNGGEEDNKDLAATTIYVVGDSTGCTYGPNEDANYYYKRVGFGTRLGEYFDESATVVNYALSGRSSKSFLTEANYASLKSNIKEGDYLLIAFGHNDEKIDDPARYTEPTGDKDTEGSFKNSLYVNYVKLAQDAGATPILVTPIVRRLPSGEYKETSSQMHYANGGSYSQAIRDLGAEVGVTVVDATTLTKDLYTELTPDNTYDLHAWLSSTKESGVDNTHLNNYGAAYISYLIADAIKSSDNSLKDYVKDGIAVPDKATNLIVNPNYVEPSNEDLTLEQIKASPLASLFKTTDPWLGTAFGDIGGQSKLTQMEDTTPIPELAINDVTGESNFLIEEVDNGVRIRTGDVANNQSFGKIAGTTDAFTLYYMPVDAKSNFEISATANVNALLAGNTQNSFGAICLDRILVNENAKETYNYLAAGAIKYGETANVLFTREATTTTGADGNEKVTYGAIKGLTDAKPHNPVAGDKIDIKITKVGNKYTLTYGDTTTTVEREMEGTVYFGFYTTRNADVTFTNISYNNEVKE